MNRRRRRIATLAAVATVALLVSTGPLWGSYLGRQLAWLTVERVEVSGTHLLAPHEVLAASGIQQGEHLLDDREGWEAALEAHPVIATATVTRKPPGTLRIRVQEERPVALVDDGTLRFATAAGLLLPLGPSGLDVDLPIVRGSLADSAGAPVIRKILAETDRLTRIAPALLAEVSEIGSAAGEPDALKLLHPAGDIIVPFGASARRIAELTAVLADVRRRSTAAPDPDASRDWPALQFDLRYGEQIVVRPSPTRELS